MDIHVLEYFQLVARSESLTKAANSLHISPSALSKAIKHLEDEIGFLLFDRSLQKMSLTPAGTLFLKDVNNILSLMKKSIEDGRRISTQQDAGLVIAHCYGGTPIQILKGFHAEFPDIKLKHYLYPGETIVQQLLMEKLDVAILDRRYFDSRLNWTPLIREELLLGVNPEHPLAQNTTIQFQDLVQFHFNCNSFMVPASYIEETGKKYGIMLEVSYEGNDFLLEKDISPKDTNAAVFLASSSVADFYSRDPAHFDDEVKVLRISPAIFFRELGLVRYDEHPLSEVGITYFDYVMDYYKEVNILVERMFQTHFGRQSQSG